MNRERVQARWMLLPAFVWMAVIAVQPVLATAWLSLRRMVLVFHEDRFVGLANYAFLRTDARFWSALGNTAYFTVVAVAVELALALPLAVVLDQSFRGRGALRVAVLLPWAIPTVVSARLWAWLFNPDYGLFAHLFAAARSNWLGTPGPALHAAILVDVWKTTPFVALLLLAGLQTIGADVFEAAQVDGAGPFRTFLRITLPLLRPAILVAVLFRALDAFRVFDAIYVLTDGGPGNTTETLSIYAFKTLMRTGDFGYGATLSMVTFLCVLALGALFILTLDRGERSEA